MKKIFLYSMISAVLLFACKKPNENPVMLQGTIVGLDMTMTPCSGGSILFIGDTIHADPIAYRLTNVPASSGIDIENGPFPIDVELTFTIDSSRCTGWHYIITNDIRRR